LTQGDNKTYPKLTLIPVLGERVHRQLQALGSSNSRKISSMLLLSHPLELQKVFGAGIALGVKRLQCIER
jgi:hypothetical protein